MGGHANGGEGAFGGAVLLGVPWGSAATAAVGGPSAGGPLMLCCAVICTQPPLLTSQHSDRTPLPSGAHTVESRVWQLGKM